MFMIGKFCLFCLSFLLIFLPLETLSTAWSKGSRKMKKREREREKEMKTEINGNKQIRQENK